MPTLFFVWQEKSQPIIPDIIYTPKLQFVKGDKKERVKLNNTVSPLMLKVMFGLIFYLFTKFKSIYSSNFRNPSDRFI